MRVRPGLRAGDAYACPVNGITVHCCKSDSGFAYAVLISALSAQHVLALTKQPLSLSEDQAAVLLAYMRFYDHQGGGIETSFTGDKQGLGIGKRSKW